MQRVLLLGKPEFVPESFPLFEEIGASSQALDVHEALKDQAASQTRNHRTGKNLHLTTALRGNVRRGSFSVFFFFSYTYIEVHFATTFRTVIVIAKAFWVLNPFSRSIVEIVWRIAQRERIMRSRPTRGNRNILSIPLTFKRKKRLVHTTVSSNFTSTSADFLELL